MRHCQQKHKWERIVTRVVDLGSLASGKMCVWLTPTPKTELGSGGEGGGANGHAFCARRVPRQRLEGRNDYNGATLLLGPILC